MQSEHIAKSGKINELILNQALDNFEGNLNSSLDIKDFDVSFTNCKIFFPIKDRDNQPITVINMIDNNISRPGIEKGK